MTGTGVVVLGDVMTDVVVLASGDLARGSDVAARIATRGGGSAANVAAWLAADGHDVAFVGRVGTDAFGDAAVLELERAGVTVHVTRDSGVQTGTCVVIVDPGGERTMLPDAVANDRWRLDDLPIDDIRGGSHLHVSGYALLREGSRDAALAALAAAREAGMSTSIDASSSAPLAALGPDRFLHWAKGADIGLANADEATALTGEVDPQAAAEALTAHVGIAVVKLGADGAIAVDRDGGRWSVAAAPAPVLDTTGAGDAFAAGFLGSWSRGAALLEALEHGARLAGRAVARVGGRP